MKISIIIPCFNHQEYVATAIASALDQTIPCEIIFVNDGSTDNSLEIAKSFENRIRIVNQVNKGLPSARNTGIMWATGDFVLFLDADDILQENCVEKIIEAIKNNPDADIISPSFKCFGLAQNEVILMGNPTIEDFKTGNRIGYCSCIRRSVLLEVGGYSSKMWCGYEDLHLWYDLLFRGKKLITIQEVLWLYRVKENSMIQEANKHADELWGQISKDFPQLNLQLGLKTPLPK